MNEGRRRVILAWSFLLAAATLVVLGFFIWQWLMPKMRPEQKTPVAEKRIETELKSRVVSKYPSPSEAEALALVKQVLAVREVEKVPVYFRLGSATPQAVVDFLKAEEAAVAKNEPLEYSWLRSLDANGLLLEGVMLVSQGAEKQHKRLALLTPDATGKWQVDFDAFAQTAIPSWHDLLENNAPSAQVRVFAATDTYFNGPFRDESQWLSYSIYPPDSEDAFKAYAKIGSPQAAALRAIFSENRRMVRVTLEIRRVAGGDPRQFEISRVLAEDWVMGPTAFDEKFN
jgi:hypothetical protein